MREIEGRMKAADYSADYYDTETASEDLEMLFDAMDSYALPYMYFGSHMGDGADYGYWLSERFEYDFDGLKVSDLAEVPKDYIGEILQVSDHGNPSLYVRSRNGHVREIWSLV
jgi:hypothetical protein